MSIGTITELDPVDALGWIELDDGSRVRFGGTAISGFKPIPGVGTRVRVVDTTVGYKGVVKATRVVPLSPDADAPAAAQPPTPEAIAWSDLVAQYPRWSDVEEVCVEPALDVPPLQIPAHPLFAPWHDELTRSPVFVPLCVPPHSAPEPVEAAPEISFALGGVAFLDQATWPTCGRCSNALEMCVQLAPEVMRPFGGEGRGFVALFCFGCGVRHVQDPAVGHVGWTRCMHRVTRPEGAPTQSSRPASPTQSVRGLPVGRLLPATTWLVLRSERIEHTASSLLIGRDARAVVGPYPSELEDWIAEQGLEPPILPEDIEEELEGWLESIPPAATGGVGSSAARGAWLGGWPNWDQADHTPDCPEHGPMRQLLEYEGGQFLDGALHVFVCGADRCATTRFVAEF